MFRNVPEMKLRLYIHTGLLVIVLTLLTQSWCITLLILHCNSILINLLMYLLLCLAPLDEENNSAVERI